MDHATRRLVQHSWTDLFAEQERAADLFYAKLFELDPALEGLFTGDLALQKRRLMEMFSVAVRGLDQLDQIAGPLGPLGKRHAGYGVVPSHYGTMQAALLFTLKECLGAGFTPEVEAAWISAYQFFTKAMLDGVDAAP